jgi:multidrug efflux system outer membrane protein
LPIALLDRRPDLIQAEMQLASATYGIGIALADLYPTVSLTASGGTVSDSVSDLLDTDSIVYNTVASLLGPIFTGGARRAEVAAARARAEAAAAAYSGAVLGALRDVEDALVADRANRDRLQSAYRRLDEAQAADRIARERYQRGVESFLTVLETERRLRTAEEAMITTKSDLWNTRIDLYLALGGDWSPAGDSTDAATRAVTVGAPAARHEPDDSEVSP